jgi:three-Cys-motif partner protein
MAAPKTTIWTLDPHTRAKHAILRRYLQAWVPILTRAGYDHVAYIDGFAGPGQYSGGEDGSPIIALKSALGARNMNATVSFLFVDDKLDRTKELEENIGSLSLPKNFSVKIEGDRTFSAAFADFRQSLGGALPPTFAFIDPFGWTGVPFSVVQYILSQPSCETLITFSRPSRSLSLISRMVGLHQGLHVPATFMPKVI